MRQRVLTALLAIPIALAAMLSNSPWVIGALATIVYGTASYELTRAFTGRPGGFVALSPGFVVAVAAIILVDEPQRTSVALIILWALFALGLLGFVWIAIGKRALWMRVIASFYLFAPLLACVLVQREWTSAGAPAIHMNPVLLIVVPLWAGDSAAIFIGKLWGRHKMAPEISPNKTWEGAAAHFAASMLFGWLLTFILDVSVLQGVLCGLSAGVLGQAGDLLESLLKRNAGVKDSGSILPGHGGVLDRIDSLLLSAVPSATVLLLL